MGKETEARVMALARRQLGLITRAQCDDLRLDRNTPDRRVAKGLWLRLHQGVFRVYNGPLQRSERELGVLLRAGEGAALSHFTAARHLRLNVPEAHLIYVTVNAGRNTGLFIEGASVTHSRDLQAEGAVVRRGTFRFTNIARTLIDLSSVLDAFWLSATFRFGVGEECSEPGLAQPRCRAGKQRTRRPWRPPRFAR
ncbi:MAG: type IV toxin-antitoxin system AbiEi family antitoxin domain-containing protein [Myxococcaceae bacterium]